MLFLILPALWLSVPPGEQNTTPASLSAESSPNASTHRLSLGECLERSMTHFGQLKQAELQVRIQEAQRSQAFWAWFTPIEVLGTVGGPTAEAHGNGSFLRTEASLRGDPTLGEAGFYAGYSIKAAIPFYTFGKLSALRDAAESGVRIAEGNVTRVKNETRANLTRAYFGYSLAQSFLNLVDESEKSIDNLISTANDLIKKNSLQVGDNDVFMLRALRGQLLGKKAEAQQGALTSKEVVRFLIDYPDDEDFELEITNFVAPSALIGSVDLFETYAVEHRPEARMARQAVLARDHAVAIRRGQLFPDFLVVAFLSQNYTSNRDEQTNPFLVSTNDLTGGLGLAVRLTLDVPTKLAQLREAEAERTKAELDQGQLQKAVVLQVRKAYAEATGAFNQIKEYQKAEKAGKSWLVSSTINFESGLTPANEVFQAVRAYSELGASRRKAEFDFTLAEVSLAEALGTETKTVAALFASGSDRPFIEKR